MTEMEYMDAPPRHTGAQVITIGKKRYLVGLAWRSFDRAQKIGELRDLGNSMFPDDDGEPMGAEWYASRPISDEIVQAGFCRRPEGVKNPAGLVALAPLIASVRMQPWLGTFRIADGLWWYVAVRDGHTIVPAGDAIGDRDYITALREYQSGIGEWNFIDGRIEDLEVLINESQERPSRVHPLSGFAITPGVIAAGIGAVVVAGGLMGWFHHQKVEEMQKQKQIALARARARMEHKVFIEHGRVPSPLETQPMPDEWLTSCRQAAGRMPISLSGWVLQSYECNATTNSVVVTWKREAGATILFRPPGSLSPGGDTVYSSIPMEKQMRGIVNSGARPEDGREALIAWAQALGVKLSVTIGADPSPLPGQKGMKEAASPQSHADGFSFSFEIPFMPGAMGLDKVPGARISGLSFDGLKWRISGNLYQAHWGANNG